MQVQIPAWLLPAFLTLWAFYGLFSLLTLLASRDFCENVFLVNACRLLSALPSLSQFGRGRLSLVAISFYALLPLFGPCRFSEFTLAGPHVQKSPLSAILSVHNHHER